jgi:hypothetical protein
LSMKPSKRKKKIRWAEMDARNPRRAKIIRCIASKQAERLKRNG